MGKNKGKTRGSGAQNGPGSSGPAPSPPVAPAASTPQPVPHPEAAEPPRSPKSFAVEQVSEGIKGLNLQDGQEHNREDVVAARKAKAAAKAEKAAKAAAKKAAEAALPPKDDKANAPSPAKSKPAPAQNHGAPIDQAAIEAAKARAIALRAEKAAKEAAKTEGGGKKEKTQGVEGGGEQPVKSNLKQGGQSSTSEKGVRFGVARTQSEENLMIAMKHAEEVNTKIPSPAPEVRELLHPSLLPLFDKCERGEVGSPDELCIQFFECAREFIKTFTESYHKMWTDEGAEGMLGNMMEEALRAQINHLTQEERYPLPYSLGNLVRQLRREMVKVGVEEEGRKAVSSDDLLEWLADAEHQNFHLANSAISDHLKGKIAGAAKIVTYDWCPVVNRVLHDSVTRGALHKLSLIDAVKNGPAMRHLFSLSHFSGYVEYGDLTCIGRIFERGSLLLLGCSAVLSSGRVALPRGGVQLAILARHANVPVLVLAPTYKFVDKAQLSPRLAFLGRAPLDILPPDLITAIVTDIRLLPPSSAPAVLKAKALDDSG